MTLDRERIMVKPAFIREQVVSFRELLAAKTREEIIGDPWLTKGLIYSFKRPSKP